MAELRPGLDDLSHRVCSRYLQKQRTKVWC